MNKYKTLTVIIVAAVILCANTLFAAEAKLSSDSKPSQKSDNSLVNTLKPVGYDTRNDEGYAKQLLISVLMVFVLGSIAYGLSKKLLPKISASSSASIVIKETTRLGPGKNLHIIEVPDEGKFLIGSTNNNISMISKLGEN